MDFPLFLSQFPNAIPVGANQWLAPCPAHDDARPSLSIGLGAEGRRLLHCHAGCSLDEILAAARLTSDDLFATPRLRAVEGSGAPRSPGQGSGGPFGPRLRLAGRYESWWGAWQAAQLIGEERRVADAARAAADNLPDPESEAAWALRALAAELDASAAGAEAVQDAELRARHDAQRKEARDE